MGPEILLWCLGLPLGGNLERFGEGGLRVCGLVPPSLDLVQSIPAIDKTLPLLRLLCLNENKISALDGVSMARMPHLEVLKLDDNSLTSIPSELGALSNLQVCTWGSRLWG